MSARVARPHSPQPPARELSTADVHTRPAAAGRPWALALVVAVPLAIAYLIAAPAAGDLAAATYRGDLFARVGFGTWDTGWYAAHGYWLPSYSLLSPALGAWLGVRVLLALSALAGCALFGAIVERVLPAAAARAAAIVFALGFCVGMLSGRVPFDLGTAIALASVLALLRASPSAAALSPALALALLAAAASPVAGAFLALVALAASPWLGRRWLWLAFAAIAPVLVLGVVYPNGGYEPFAASSFWPALAATALIAVLLPRGPLARSGHAALRTGAVLYALALIGAYALHTPMGGNAARLGALLAAPLLVGVLWRRHRAVLALLALPLLYWQLATPLKDYAGIAGDPSTHASYYAPLLAELKRLSLGASHGGRGEIIEVPMTKAHWEAAYLPWHSGVRLARGWERQLDTRYAALFYRPTLTAGSYRRWLGENRVRYVALPDAPLDHAGAQEGALVARGLPYLQQLWRSEHWRLYRFMG